jgi:proteasome assembly chaperone (PAC2) family protein
LEWRSAQGSSEAIALVVAVEFLNRTVEYAILFAIFVAEIVGVGVVGALVARNLIKMLGSEDKNQKN